MRRRPAPSADRTASSRVRTVARASSRLATLAQQMRSTNPTTPRNSIDVQPQIAADHRIVHPLERHAAALVGLRNSRARPSATVARSASAALIETPGFMRPTTCSM